METNNNLSKQNYINNLLNKYFNLFVVVFVSFLLLLAYSFLLKPKADETTNAISENISSHEKLLQAEKNKLSSLQEAVIAYKTINPTDLARVNAILPDEYNKEALYGEIEEIVKQNGFTPALISITNEVEAPVKDASSTKAVAKPVSKIGIIDVTLDVSSIDYAGTKKLLGILENNLRLIDVKNVGMGDDGRSAVFTFNTYYYKK